jgi:hypothetical protein
MKDWNAEAFIAYQLIKAGAKLDLVVAKGKTVGELAMVAAVKAKNPQLISILHDAGVAKTSLNPRTTDAAGALENHAVTQALAATGQ